MSKGWTVVCRGLGRVVQTQHYSFYNTHQEMRREVESFQQAELETSQKYDTTRAHAYLLAAAGCPSASCLPLLRLLVAAWLAYGEARVQPREREALRHATRRRWRSAGGGSTSAAASTRRRSVAAAFGGRRFPLAPGQLG